MADPGFLKRGQKAGGVRGPVAKPLEAPMHVLQARIIGGGYERFFFLHTKNELTWTPPPPTETETEKTVKLRGLGFLGLSSRQFFFLVKFFGLSLSPPPFQKTSVTCLFWVLYDTFFYSSYSWQVIKSMKNNNWMIFTC